MKTKKLLSLFLSVIMIMSVIPMYASAADPIALTVDNIAVYPTANGSIYFGQKINEGVTLTGGEVQYDGAVVAGHFEFAEPEFRPTSWASAYRPIMIFVPDEADIYESFEVPASKNTTFAVEKTTPVFVDENDTVPVTTEIESGAKLSTITLSGAKVYNPYYPEEPKALAEEWVWSSKSTVVTESGYYEAKLTITGYVTLKKMVYVRVAGDTSEVKLLTTVEEAPVITNTLNIGDDWSALEFAGGKVVDVNGDAVKGTFSHSLKGMIGTAGTRQVEFLFTPDNELYATATVKVTAIVNAIPISFGPDHKGTSIDDPYVLEVEPNADMGTVRDELKNYHLNWPGSTGVQIEDYNGTAENGRIYEFKVSPYNNSNYTGNIAYVKLVFKDVEFAVSSASYTEEINVRFNSNKPNGTFDVYVDGKLIGDDVKLANDRIKVPYAPETSGTHTVKVVYNPTENDYYFMADYEAEIQVNVKRNITTEGLSSRLEVNGSQYNSLIVNGAEISVECVLPDVFAGWEITDTNGNVIDLGVDLTANKITFTMPDQDIVVKAKSTLDEEEKPDDGTGDGTGDGTDDDTNNGIFGGIWAFFQKLINWFISIIKQMMSLFGLGA